MRCHPHRAAPAIRGSHPGVIVRAQTPCQRRPAWASCKHRPAAGAAASRNVVGAVKLGEFINNQLPPELAQIVCKRDEGDRGPAHHCAKLVIDCAGAGRRTVTKYARAATTSVLARRCAGAGLRAVAKYERVECAVGEEDPVERFLTRVEPRPGIRRPWLFAMARTSRPPCMMFMCAGPSAERNLHCPGGRLPTLRPLVGLQASPRTWRTAQQTRQLAIAGCSSGAEAQALVPCGQLRSLPEGKEGARIRGCRT